MITRRVHQRKQWPPPQARPLDGSRMGTSTRFSPPRPHVPHDPTSPAGPPVSEPRRPTDIGLYPPGFGVSTGPGVRRPLDLGLYPWFGAARPKAGA